MESNLKKHEDLRKKDLVSSDRNINSLDYETNSIVKNFLLLPLKMEYSQLLQDKQK